jgi:uncharacterized protein (TIGR03435 family)
MRYSAKMLNKAKHLFSAAASMMPLPGLVLVGLMNAPASRGQSRVDPRPEFAVTSVKPTNLNLRQQIDMRALPNGGLTATSVTLQFLIKVAYGVQASQISGGPGWLTTEKYDILAKPEDGAKPQILPMLQSLLEDRFKLAVRHTTKDLPVYELRMARSDGKYGPNLHELKPGNCQTGPPQPSNGPSAPCAGFLSAKNRLSGHRVTMSALTSPLSSILERPVLDKAGLTGEFDLDLYWTPDATLTRRGDAVQVPPDVSEASLFTALKEQLGLRLEGARGLVNVLVIERAEKPDEN